MAKINQTKNYEMFIFRDDNRDKIDHAHVARLRQSILTCNMLDLKPILVNGRMEIIDGQHRFLAAKSLGADIYYQIQDELDSREVMLLNISKAWGAMDYLNYWVNNGGVEYIKLLTFMKDNDLSLRVALNICIGSSIFNYKKFKEGEFKFHEDVDGEALQLCWDTIEYIRKMNGFSPYTESSRFWRALIKLVTHHRFNPVKWRNNLKRMVERCTAKASANDYCKMLMEIYNWKNADKVNLMETPED